MYESTTNVVNYYNAISVSGVGPSAAGGKVKLIVMVGRDAAAQAGAVDRNGPTFSSIDVGAN